jgi:hypothetical protein
MWPESPCRVLMSSTRGSGTLQGTTKWVMCKNPCVALGHTLLFYTLSNTRQFYSSSGECWCSMGQLRYQLIYQIIWGIFLIFKKLLWSISFSFGYKILKFFKTCFYQSKVIALMKKRFSKGLPLVEAFLKFLMAFFWPYGCVWFSCPFAFDQSLKNFKNMFLSVECNCFCFVIVLAICFCFSVLLYFCFLPGSNFLK